MFLNEPRVSVIGLGKLGSPMAAVFASRGFSVIGVDALPAAVEALNRGEAPVDETGLAELIAGNSARLTARADTASAVTDSDASFIIVPTPSDDQGRFALDAALAACREIGRGLAQKDSYHLVVMTSTVMPGACRESLIPALEAASGKRAGRDFGFCYSPEFIALGSVIRDFLNPDFSLIGEADETAGAALAQLYTQVVANGAPARRMSLESAELAKIALNSYVTTKISFANTLAEICHAMPGADVDAVTGALGLDRRIGKAYLSGGLGFGGPCFPRDNIAFRVMAKDRGIKAELAKATDLLNHCWLDNHVSRIAEATPPGGRVAVLGLAYKPTSAVVTESQAVQLAQRLADRGYGVRGYDPLARETARAALGPSVTVTETVSDAVARADTIVIANPDPAFKDLDWDSLDLLPGVTVYDLWRLCETSLAGRAELRYLGYGQGDRAAALGEVLVADRRRASS